MANPQVIISMEEYEELRFKEDKLEALIDAGVEEWQGYEYAMDSLWFSKGKAD